MGKMAVAAIVSLWVVPISILFNRIVPQPYMDEIFHIPQAQEFCKSNFRSWDPMITTPPGLYYLSLAHIAYLFPGMLLVRSSTSSFLDACSVGILRSTNGVLAIVCSAIVHGIITHLRPGLDDKKATLYSVVLALYPLHWFFTFLYYTDVASLTAVLAMYLACLKKHYWLSALLGALAVSVRQTNIIWMLFVASSEVINIALVQKTDDFEFQDITSIAKNHQQALKESVPSGSNLRKRKNKGIVETAVFPKSAGGASSEVPMPGLVDEVLIVARTILLMKKKLFISFAPYILVCVAFVAFVRWNGSVVLGAKEAHAVSPHFAQILYFALFSALFMAPLYFTFGHVANFLQSLWKHMPSSFIQTLLAITAGIVSVHYFSIAHPYLLADNRHYPFYLWRKVIKSHSSTKYLLVPLYVYSWISMSTRLGKVQRTKIWVLGYFLATALVLIPAPLIEFRYYTVPFFLLALHSHDDNIRSWFLMGSLYLALNIFTVIMFLYRPFHWDHEPGTQRFIW